MKTHIKIVSVKIFEEDDILLQDLSKEYGIKNISSLIRKAVSFWHENRKLHQVIQKQTEQMAITNEKIEDLYFKIDTLTNKK